MANKSLFSWHGTRNESGGIAYKGSPKASLAQLATTSCLNNTLYCSAEQQLNDILVYAAKVEPEYLAKVAVFSREKYDMRDIPALLCAILTANKKTDLLKKVFPRVIDNGDMLRNYFQMIRSGITGRKSFGSVPKKLMIDWFNSRTPAEIFGMSVGTPSMRDILRCIHPRPLDRKHSAIYAWLLGKEYESELLPDSVQQFENFKKGESKELPKVPFQMLTSFSLNSEQWATVARRAGWLWLLKNINNMIKHEVFSNYPEMVDFVAARISDKDSVRKAKAFPYRILSAYKFATNIPKAILSALHEAMEVATDNVPVMPEAKSGNPPLYVLMDVSKSMTFPVTGNRYDYGNRANTSMKCVDVGALIACSLLRKNKGSEIVLFNTKPIDFAINPNNPILENANRISEIATGGTACSAALKSLNQTDKHSDLIVLVSDNQSWVESLGINRYGGKEKGVTELQKEWDAWKFRNPNSKLVCIDVAPYTTTQVQERKDILNIGGWGDECFKLISMFCRGELGEGHLISIIESVEL